MSFKLDYRIFFLGINIRMKYYGNGHRSGYWLFEHEKYESEDDIQLLFILNFRENCCSS